MNRPQIQSFKLAVLVLEDLHTGSGRGGADVDALLALDSRGRPTIRWSHLRGLLKQALIDRGAALGLAVGAEVVRLFGKPQTLQDTRYARGSLAGLGLRVTGKTRKSIVWVSTAREPGTRVPKTDTLRRVEYVPAGTRFSGELRVSNGNGDADLVGKLLKRLNRIGGDRSRGAGLVSLIATPSLIELPVLEQDLTVQAASPRGHRVLFQALDPVALAATGEPGNLIRGHSHLSASAVHGMLVRWAMESGNTKLAQALLDRRIVCGPAYPVPPKVVKKALAELDVVPFPLSFQAPKPDPQVSTWPWWAQVAAPEGWIDTLTEARKPEDERRREKLKRPGGHDYLVRTAEGWARFRCEPGQVMRNDAGTSQRANAKQNLRTVEEVPEDTGFLTCIQATDAAAEQWLLPALRALQQGKHWLQAGRGGAPLVVQAYETLGSATNSNPDVNDAATKIPADTVRILVESDLILRAPDLRFHTRLDRSAVLNLLKQAGAAADLMSAFERDLSSAREVSEPTEVRGRNVATAGPRLPALAIRRGSEAELTFNTTLRANQCRALLAAAAWRGLGERAAEGHGRLRVDFTPAPGSIQDTGTDGGLHEGEALLEEALNWLGQTGLNVGLFTSTRWQALRNASRADGDGPFEQWLTQANREADRLKGTDKASAETLKSWLNKLGEAVRPPEPNKELRSLDARKRPLLRTLALLAAKHVAGKRKSNPGKEGDHRE